MVHEPELLEVEAAKLSLLRWVFTRMPAADPWQPAFERYLSEIAERVRGLGGDHNQIHPSPNGDGGHGDAPRGVAPVEGNVVEVRYDCVGQFVGFVLASCDGRHELHACEAGIERGAIRACAKGYRLRVQLHSKDPHRVVKMIVLCC